MRPLKLTMSAFGPYAGEETIDFTKLQEKNIFLVTGPTGAGKTTIFDAISYALFGEASGTSRDKDSLRSDFATLDIPTFVELEFELRGRKYCIRRYPQQERKRSRGEGAAVKSAEAQLVLPNDEIITRVTVVDEKINEILGINKNQFRQIVMLPQGEFRRLLEADSVEREGIFRKIFGTEAFESIQKTLDDQKRQLYKKIAVSSTQRDTHIRHIEAQEDETLLKLINSENLNVIEIVERTHELIERERSADKELIEAISALKAEQESFQRKIVEGEELNKKLQYKKDLYTKYNELSCKLPEYEKKQIELELARKALELKQFEDSLEEAKNKQNDRKQQYEASVKAVEQAEEKLNILKQSYEAEDKKKEERKELADNIAALKSQESKVKDYEAKVTQLSTLNRELTSLEEISQKLKTELNFNKLELENTEKERLSVQNAETQLEKLKKKETEMKNTISDMRMLYSSIRKYFELSEDHRKKGLSFETWDLNYKNLKRDFDSKEETFKRGQAGLLALDLKDGTECPVCGSIHHPKPAKLLEGIPTEAELQENKNKLEALNKQREEKYAELSNLNGQMNSIKADFPVQIDKLKESLGEKITQMDPKELLLFLSQDGKRLAEEIKIMEEEMLSLQTLINKKDILDKKTALLKQTIQASDTKIEESIRNKTLLYGQIKAGEESIESIKKEIPEELRSFNSFLEKIKQLEVLLKEKEQRFNTAQSAFNTSKESLAALIADRDVKHNNLKEITKEAEESSMELQQKLEASGFADYNHYHSLIIPEKDIKALDVEIQNFFQELKSLKDRLVEAEKETEGLLPIVLAELKEKVKLLYDKQISLEQQEKSLYSRINNNIKALKEIDNITNLIKEDETRYSVVGKLASIANGDNSERITFERFVLAAYFDEIIDTANIRLSKMAGGRFVLKRKEEKGKGRKQEGLELEVFDNYTGKARHVKTLSGGESFKASLALALGLADVVQNHAGGISLDTMFVDEGFGTLDPESLDMAIQCLIDLQADGRLVGIISHVPELKERIDVRLEITPAKEGSKAKFIL